MWLADVFIRSQLFIAFCAVALGFETYLVAQTPAEFRVLAVIFFSSLFIYNGSRMSVSLNRKTGSQRFTLNVEGSKLYIVISCISVVILFGLLTACSWQQLLVIMIASLFSLAYTIPFSYNGKTWQGLRRNVILKNIVLSITWAVATVLLPLTNYNSGLLESEIVFMFLRRLFFIYSLAVIYDLRDIEPDRVAGIETFPLKFGEKRTQLWAMVSLLVFAVLVLTDPFLVSDPSSGYAFALLISAAVAALVILNTHNIRKKKYYSLVVDGNMMLQLILVWLMGFV